jgi:hypothetical protein
VGILTEGCISAQVFSAWSGVVEALDALTDFSDPVFSFKFNFFCIYFSIFIFIDAHILDVYFIDFIGFV